MPLLNFSVTPTENQNLFDGVTPSMTALFLADLARPANV